MALDRQSIEKRDFPIARRGYDPAAVDAHLESLALEVEALKRESSSRSGESLAPVASAQLQAIVQAAEQSAAEIEQAADSDATRIRQEAERFSERTRSEAIERANEHVRKVSEGAAVMAQRVDTMESELSALTESLRTGANRIKADLALLEGNMSDLYGAAGAQRGEAPAREPVAAAAPAEAADEPATADPAREDPAAEQPAAAEQPVAAAGSGDVEGARLIALNMALDGQPRNEADRYLADNFDLADRKALLDEVYAAVEG